MATAFTGLPASNAGTLSIAELRSAAARDPKAAIRETAKQFEALFMQQLMKSMREATVGKGMLDNEGSKLGTEMLDSQYALKMTGLPGGLTDAIARQLERQMGTGSPAAPVAPAAGGVPAASTLAPATPLSRKQVDFVQQHGAAARAAEAQSGIPAAFMIGQAAHESGWGRQEIRNADGSNAKNLFGIKAGAGWNGPVAEITTTEYVDGAARKVTAKFRAYASYEESFRDYARLIGESPRYAQARAQTGSATAYASELQRAGYATDPAYAAKLSRAINTSLQLQRSQG